MNGEQANAVAAGRWASRMVRLAVASIFAAAVVPKWQHGWASVQGTVEYIRSSFAESWLPGPMVAGYAYAVAVCRGAGGALAAQRRAPAVGVGLFHRADDLAGLRHDGAQAVRQGGHELQLRAALLCRAVLEPV